MNPEPGPAVGSGRPRPWDRLNSRVWRRAFPSAMALGYEGLIAPAVFGVVRPLVDQALGAGTILDVGCGGGRLAADLARRRAVQVVGVDPSLPQARRLARRGGPAATMAWADALPFRESGFDAVISSCAFKHWPDPVAGLRECARVLRPGGQIVLVEIDGDSTSATVRAFARRTRIPPGLREAYVRLTMRTVVRLAPTRSMLTAALGAVFAEPTSVSVGGLPFLVATAVR